MTNLSKSLTGVAGEYFVAFLISSKLGYAVGLTARGTPAVDLIVTNPMNGKSLAIQVKTGRNACVRNKTGGVLWKWHVGKGALESAGKDLYWAFVDLKDGQPPTLPDVYFCHSSELKPRSTGLNMYLNVYQLTAYPKKDVWFDIKEPDASKYRNNLVDVVRKRLQ